MPDSDSGQGDPPLSPRALARLRFRKMMMWMAMVSLVAAIAAVIIVAQSDSGFHIHMLIATALGVGLTVLLGTALMSLAFLSASSGHDDQAAQSQKRDDQ